MHGYDFHEIFYLNYENHDPWDKGLRERAGTIKPSNENVLNPRKYSSLLPHMWEKKLDAW